MLQHQPEPEPASSRSLPVKADYVSTQLETYLDKVSPPPEDSLTEGARQERRAEMKTHLEALIDAYIELGDTPEQAVANALRQFGATKTVGREWRRVLPLEGTRSARRALGGALLFNGAACLLAMTVLPVAIGRAANLGSNAVGTLTDINLYVLPAVAGLLTGLHAPRRPMRSTLYALALLLLPMMACDAWQSSSLGPTMWQVGLLSQLAIFGMLWIPIGCTTAGLTGLAKRCITRPLRMLATR